MRWVVDGNNVFGSRPDGWWNDRAAAAARLAGSVADWCRDLDDDVTLVFDPPLDPSVAALAGGNLAIVEAPRRGRDAADDHVVDLVAAALDDGVGEIAVVTSDRGLRRRLGALEAAAGPGAPPLRLEGAGRFLDRLATSDPRR